jgi:osmotically-inducible protein OsmY
MNTSFRIPLTLSTCLARPLATVLAASTLALALGACAPVIMGGAMLGGGLVATDRRTSGIQLEDEGIELRSGARLREAIGDRGHLNITSYNRQVLVTGEVPTEQDKQKVSDIVSRVENVRAVVNELAVMPNTSLTDRSSDVLITGRARASLVDARDLFANAFKVVTERGTVHLLGRVTQREANRATELVRTIPGVKRVVRVFEIISEDELRNLLPPPPAPAPTAKPAK